MTKLNKYYFLIILLSGVLVSILLNLKLLWHFLDLISDKGLINFSEDEYEKLKYTIQQAIGQFLIFSLLGLFNFSWKDKVVKPEVLNQTVGILYIIIANLIIIFLIAFFQTLLINSLYKGKDIFASIFYYSWINFFVYILTIPLAYILRMNKNLKETKNENLILKTEKANAELISLKEQLSPHFFFNTLNSLSAVIRTAEKSDSLEFVEKLSQVYRYILDSENNNLVIVKEEIDFLDDYAYLLHKRFGNNFMISNRINATIFKYRIPPLALQVLLENVTKHNKLLSSSPVKISIENTEEFILFRNEMKKKEGVESHGTGLNNLNKRCMMLCGKEIEIVETKDEFCVKIPIIR